MKRLWKLPTLSRNPQLSIPNSSPLTTKTLLKPYQNPNPPNPYTFRFVTLIRSFSSTPLPSSPSANPIIHTALEEKVPYTILELVGQLVNSNGDSDVIHSVMEDQRLSLLNGFSDGCRFIQLMNALQSFPQLAVEVFNWRRKHNGFNSPVTAQEYAKGIIAAGRAKYVELATDLFTEAANNNVKTSSTYNALLRVYLINDFPRRCQSLFQKFQRDETCIPTITTYNILISVFGRLMLVDHMEETLRQIYAENFSPNVNTFNNLIAGYVTAWMWDHMEKAYKTMKMASIEPDTNTHLLMLRGYAYSGNLTKMENIYALIKKEDLIRNNLQLIRSMICAYCKSSHANRVEKIEALMNMIPKEEYCPWLNVLLIKVYAEEQLVNKMEKFIDIAFENHTAVTNSTVMREIVTVYYQLRDVDRFASFLERAEKAGWKLCLSIYHCKMVMYRSQNRLEEMENVRDEMERFSLWSQSKKTLTLLCEAYTKFGPRCKLEQVAGLMCKRGYGIPMEYMPS